MSGTLSLHGWDIAVLLLSLVAVYAAGILGSRRQRQTEAEYVLAGRTLTLPFFVASLVATWYGAVLGSGEFIVRHGIAFILCFGVPYYLVAIGYARWLANRIRRSEAVSIPDQIGAAYGPVARTVAAVIMLVITIPASYQLMLGVILQSVTGWPLLPSIIVGTVVSLLYVVRGGLRSDVAANVVQLVLMYAGMAALVVASMVTFGWPTELLPRIPPSHGSLPGPLGWTPILVWSIVALQTFVDPNFHVRAAAARTTTTARRGIMISVGMWMVFDALQLMAGLYALVHVQTAEPAQAYLALAQAVLPVVWKGLFLAGIVAAVMSTLDGYALVSATTIGHDLIDARSGRTPSVRSLRIGLGLTALAGTLAAWWVPSIIDLVYHAASMVVPALLLPLLRSFGAIRVRERRAIVLLMVLPAISSAASLISGLGEPMIVGLGVSLCLFLFLGLRRDP
jgi:SSS family solute:Na+ symporter